MPGGISKAAVLHANPEDEFSASSSPSSASDTDNTSVSPSSASKIDQTGFVAGPKLLRFGWSPTAFHLRSPWLPGPGESRNQAVHSKFWELWDHDDLVHMAPAVADFFCASQLFELAFEVSYRLSCALLEAERLRCDDVLLSALLTCMRSAHTPELYAQAISVARLGTGSADGSIEHPGWFTIYLKLFEHDLTQAFRKRSTIQLDLPREVSPLERILIQFTPSTPQRERVVSAIKNQERMQKAGSCSLTLDEARQPMLGLDKTHDSPSSQVDRHNRYYCRGTGERLLKWCSKVLEEESERLGFLVEFSKPSPPDSLITQRKALLSDSLFRFLLRKWPRKPPLFFSIPLESLKVTSLSDYNTSAVHFDLFEALATFSPLILAKVPPAIIMAMEDCSLKAATPVILQTVKRLLNTPLPFHKIFLEVYLSRISTPTSKVIRPHRYPEYVVASTDFANSLGALHINNFLFCDTGEDLMPAPRAHTTPLLASQANTDPRCLPYNDPMLFRRDSGSSSLFSHLSAICNASRASLGSTHSREKRPPSSAAMSVDSWKLNACFPMSDTSSVRESAPDNDSVMLDDEQHPGWI